MRTERHDPAHLWDMVQAAQDVVEFVAGRTWEQYQRDKMLRAAVERKVEIIGEAARGVSDALKSANPSIPWVPIMTQRHRLVHEYASVRDELIWKVATVHVPDLLRLLRPLLPAPPADPDPAPPAAPTPPEPPPIAPQRTDHEEP